MKRRLMILVSLGTIVGFGNVGCADESAPNRRGIERPPLAGGQDALDRAEKRETEAPKRELPIGEKEYPGQSMLNTPSENVVILADVGEPGTTTVPATPTQAGPISSVEAGAVVPPVTSSTMAKPVVPAAAPMSPTPPPAPVSIESAIAPVTAEGALVGDAITLPPLVAPAYKDFNDNKPYAVPGRTMIVPETGGLTIDPTWGEPTVLDNYPHRPYADTTVNYIPGTAPHNPVYYHDLFAHPYRAAQTPDTWTSDAAKDYAEIPWFFGETIALPVLMVINPPLAHRETRVLSGDPLYEGKLPAGGDIVPAPYTGELHWHYPTVEMPPETNPTTRPVTPP